MPGASARLQGLKAGAAFALVLLLAGCATAPGTGRAPDAGVALPSEWSDGGNANAAFDQAAYWQALGDPMLTELVEAALANNLDIAQSASRLAQAREGLVQANASFLPSLNASGSGTRAIGTGASSDVVTNIGLNASWELDLFGRIGKAANAASYDYASAGYALDDLRRLIAGQVAQQVISARSTAQQLAIARDTLKVQDENLQIARWRLQAGLVSSLDVEQARSQRAQTAASIPLLESSLAATSHSISTLIGEPPGRVLGLLSPAVAMPTPPALGGLAAPADLLRRRPDIRQAESQLLADTARVGVARAQLYPLLTLSGNIGTSDAGPQSLFDIFTGSIIGSISQLLFDGGRTTSRIRAAEAVTDGSLANWQKSILSGLEEVEGAIVSRKSADARLGELTEALDAASNAAILARSQYQAGLTDFQTLLTAESSLLSARNSLVAAQADRASAFVQLTQALGGGWTDTNGAYEPDDGNTP